MKEQECVYCEEALEGPSEATVHHTAHHPDERFDPVWYLEEKGTTSGKGPQWLSRAIKWIRSKIK